MPLYIADYLADTGHLSMAEHGAYVLLIMHYWQNGGLPSDETKLARICRATPKEWAAVRDTVAALFGESWTHKRIDAEIAKASDTISKRSAAGKAGASARYGKRNANGMANAEQTHAPPPSPPPSPQERNNKEDIRPDGRSTPAKFEFEGRHIRLTKSDHDQWRKAFTNLDLDAELLALDEWAGTQGKGWFHAVSGALAKKNREAGERLRAIKVRAETEGKEPTQLWDPRL
jgi:uncharacterized protein YdaU (DUF1376 family)